MNDILAVSSTVSMTSREIAELVGSRHDKVKQSIERLMERGVISQPPVGDGEKAANGVVEKLYIFSGQQGRRDSIVVVAQLSPKFTARLVDRWQELEDQVAKPSLPTDYISALEALVASEKAKAALAQDNALLNTIIDNEFGYCSILRAAQHLGVHETTFRWQVLKKETLASGLEIKRVPSPRYNYQNLYPICAFERCYPQFDFSGLQPEAVAKRATRLLTGSVSALTAPTH